MSAPAPQGPKTRAFVLPKPARWIRELLALLLWGAAFIQLFAFDVGNYLTGRLPGLEWVLRFRFVILLGLIAALSLLLGNRRFILFAGYIVLYPFIVVFWVIPRLLFRNWAVVVAFSPALYSVLAAFRTNFILFSTALVSGVIVCLTGSRPLVISCMALLVLYLVIHYVRRFRVAFSSSTVFSDVSVRIRDWWGRLKEGDLASRPAGLDPESEEYKQKFGQNLLSSYLMTTALFVVSQRLQQVINSRKMDLYLLASLLYTFVLTSVIFAVEYLGLERIAPGSFAGAQNPSFWSFLGFSFSTLMTSDVAPIRPASGIAQGAVYLQLFGSLLIVVLLVFLILTSIRERYRQDLDGVVAEIGAASDRSGKLLEANYELTLSAAEAWLLRFNAPMMKWLLKLRYGEARALEIAAESDDAN